MNPIDKENPKCPLCDSDFIQTLDPNIFECKFCEELGIVNYLDMFYSEFRIVFGYGHKSPATQILICFHAGEIYFSDRRDNNSYHDWLDLSYKDFETIFDIVLYIGKIIDNRHLQ